MESSAMEKGVLKLVHPGRHVEIHRRPITAGEIMRKNPRHCIARPDVFEYPWIVVRPESVLVPGKVFYIVPNITIHQLLKARGHNQPMKKHNHHHWAGKRATPKSWAGMTPKHQPNDLCLENEFQNMALHEKISHPDPEETVQNKSIHHQEWRQIENGELKSCMRKQDSVRKWHNLKVTFALPTITTSRLEAESPKEPVMNQSLNWNWN